MTPVAAGSAIGAAALTVGRGVLGAAASGLSFAAELARASLGTGESAEGAAEQDAALRAGVEARREELAQRIQRHLAERGISLFEPVELISDGMGGIAVAVPHPQQAVIEGVLGDDLLLERDFQQLAIDLRELGEEISVRIAKSP